ncbi:MAG: hypothetical protein TREMPRED_003003, partial [Tremellales sp. Tagirdzhanova-0007]
MICVHGVSRRSATPLQLSRCFSLSARRFQASPITRLTVFGAGTMGTGISQVALQKGVDVVLCDPNVKALEKAQAFIRQQLSENSSDRADSLSTSTNTTEAVKGAELIIEAIPERLQLKHDLFRAADKAAGPDCLFATNTSSLRIAEIAECSVPASPLVEVARTEEISEEAYQKLLDFGRHIRNNILPCTDAPGLVVNRLLIPVMLEAFKIIGRKQTTPKELDDAMIALSW